MYQFIAKNFTKIFAFLAICLFVFFTFVFIVPGCRPIEHQAESLYAQTELMEKDFSSVFEMNNVELSIDEDEIVAVFSEEKCSLKLTYNKMDQSITKEFQDHRLGSTAIGLVMGLLLVGMFSVMVSLYLLLLIRVACAGLDKVRSSKCKASDIPKDGSCGEK